MGGPRRWWQVLTAGFVAAGAAHAALQAMNIWALRRADAAIDTWPRGLRPPTPARSHHRHRLCRPRRAGAYLMLFLLWLLMIGAVATRLGFDRRTVLATGPSSCGASPSCRPWCSRSWPASPRRPSFWAAVRAVNQNAIAFSAIHILTTALLIAYTAVVWRRLRPTPLLTLP